MHAELLKPRPQRQHVRARRADRQRARAGSERDGDRAAADLDARVEPSRPRRRDGELPPDRPGRLRDLAAALEHGHVDPRIRAGPSIHDDRCAEERGARARLDVNPWRYRQRRPRRAQLTPARPPVAALPGKQREVETSERVGRDALHGLPRRPGAALEDDSRAALAGYQRAVEDSALPEHDQRRGDREAERLRAHDHLGGRRAAEGVGHDEADDVAAGLREAVRDRRSRRGGSVAEVPAVRGDRRAGVDHGRLCREPDGQRRGTGERRGGDARCGRAPRGARGQHEDCEDQKPAHRPTLIRPPDPANGGGARSYRGDNVRAAPSRLVTSPQAPSRIRTRA